MTASETLPRIPARDADGHKGTFGTVCVVGGNAAGAHVMIGGPALTAEAALRVGAGLAVLAVPRPLMAAALAIAPSATGLALPVDRARALEPSAVAALLDASLPGYDALAVGPGWGHDFAQQQVLVRLLGQEDTPVVLDADGLNALAALPGAQHEVRAPLVITPHPGEFARLAQALGMPSALNAGDERRDAAEDLARRLGCIVVLKGRGTVVTDGHRTSVNATGSAVLATAGTGDVLTGVIAGLVAQFHRGPDPALDLWSCAVLGAWLHGRAADIWRDRHGRAGMLARELCDLIPHAVEACREGP